MFLEVSFVEALSVRKVAEAMSEIESDKGLLSTSKMYTASGNVVKSDEESEEIELKIPVAGARMAQVGFSTRVTINLGNYESVQIGVDVRLPTYVEELEDGFRAAKKFVDDKLNSQVAEVREYKESRSSE